MPKIVQLTQLTKIYPGGIVAVDDLSLDIEEGEFITLLGPSGCGKTTTLRLIAGFETPTHGRVSLAGQDVTDLPPYQRQVNTVFQDFALFPHMTVSQNVGYGLRVTGVPKEEIGQQVAQSLGMVDLLEKSGVRPGQLSGGQKQRVALARALIRHPKVLLLDEPLSSLDAKLRGAMQIELKHLHEKLGLTFILVTHDQTEAMVMSDRIVVMEEGRIVQSGTPTEVYDHPVSAYVADFLGSSNMMTGRVATVGNDGTTIGFDGGEVRSLLDGASLTLGAAVTVSIRPEKTSFLAAGEAAPDGHNVLPGTVRDCLFQGNVIRIEMSLDIGPETPFFVEVHLRSTAQRSAMPQPGTRASIAVDPHNVSVFPMEAAQ
jgi:putative spermidine/putrescine transport system ATP-binding protein/spermidine/putrescine transport system ATP-binding protein